MLSYIDFSSVLKKNKILLEAHFPLLTHLRLIFLNNND